MLDALSNHRVEMFFDEWNCGLKFLNVLGSFSLLFPSELVGKQLFDESRV
jgi:hypothetical protein